MHTTSLLSADALVAGTPSVILVNEALTKKWLEVLGYLGVLVFYIFIRRGRSGSRLVEGEND